MCIFEHKGLAVVDVVGGDAVQGFASSQAVRPVLERAGGPPFSSSEMTPIPFSSVFGPGASMAPVKN